MNIFKKFIKDKRKYRTFKEWKREVVDIQRIAEMNKEEEREFIRLIRDIYNKNDKDFEKIGRAHV